MSFEILIIDDNSDIRFILDELIREAGYKTRLAANFSQALNEIAVSYTHLTLPTTVIV